MIQFDKMRTQDGFFFGFDACPLYNGTFLGREIMKQVLLLKMERKGLSDWSRHCLAYPDVHNVSCAGGSEEEDCVSLTRSTWGRHLLRLRYCLTEGGECFIWIFCKAGISLNIMIKQLFPALCELEAQCHIILFISKQVPRISHYVHVTVMKNVLVHTDLKQLNFKSNSLK